MANHPPPEVEELIYQFFVLRRMIEQLPGRTGELLLQQFEKVLHALSERDRIFRNKVSTLTEDAILAVKIQEFDLEATKRERDDLMNRHE